MDPIIVAKATAMNYTKQMELVSGKIQTYMKRNLPANGIL